MEKTGLEHPCAAACMKMGTGMAILSEKLFHIYLLYLKNTSCHAILDWAGPLE